MRIANEMLYKPQLCPEAKLHSRYIFFLLIRRAENYIFKVKGLFNLIHLIQSLPGASMLQYLLSLVLASKCKLNMQEKARRERSDWLRYVYLCFVYMSNQTNANNFKLMEANPTNENPSELLLFRTYC